MTVITNELALFQPGSKNYGIEECDYVSYRPSGQISNSSPIEFQISGTSSEYVLLSKTRLYVKVRVLKDDDDTAILPEHNVAFVNNAMHSLFRQVDVSLNQQVVTATVGVNYPYKSLIDVLLNHGEGQTGRLMSSGYYKDQAYAMDTIAGNSGHLMRKNLAQQGIVDFEGVLHVDIAQQPKAILNGVQIGVKLYQHDDSFRLISDGAKYKIAIDEAELKVCHLRVNPSIMLAHSERLSKSPAIYPFFKSNIKTYTIPSGSFTWSIDDIFHGFVPQKILVAFVAADAYAGKLELNPFNFFHYNCNYLEFAKYGRSIQATAFQPKFELNPEAAGEYKHTGYINDYLSIFKEDDDTSDGSFITRSDYAGMLVPITLGVENFSI